MGIMISCRTCKFHSPTFTRNYSGYKMSCDWNKKTEMECKHANFNRWEKK